MLDNTVRFLWVVFNEVPFSHPDWEGYSFGYSKTKFGPVTQELGDRILNSEHSKRGTLELRELSILPPNFLRARSRRFAGMRGFC